MSHLQYMPGDHRLVDQLVYELKSKGIFDQFRKECIADVDTKPAYQNLRQRVESSVSVFLSRQKWRPDLNKNQLREKLRKHILDGNYLEQGVERIVDQVVNPKVASCFIPKVEDLVYNYLGIPRKKTEPVAETSNEEKNDLLPTDLEAVSPGSVDEKAEKDNVKMDIDIGTEDIPIPDPIPEAKDEKDAKEVNVKEDSQMSGIIDLTSRDSEMSIDKSQIPLPAEGIKPENIPRPDNSPPEIEVQKIELPKAPYPSTEIPLPDEIPPMKQEYFKLQASDDEGSSSDSSLIRNRMSPLTPVRTFDNENSCDAQQAFDVETKDDKPAVSTFRFSIESEEKKDDLSYQFENQVNFNTPAYEDSSNSNNLQIDYESDANSKLTEKAAEAENSKDTERDKDKKSSHKSSRHSRERHSSSSKRSDSKSSRDRRDSKTEKKSEEDGKKTSKDDRKDRESRESFKHRSSSHKSSSKDTTKSSSSSKHTKSDDRKSSSSTKPSSSRDKSKDSKSKTDKERKSSSKKDEKKKDKKDTDDHYSLSGRGNSSRRSTDRDSNDGNSSSSKSSNINPTTKTEAKNGKSSSKSENTSSSEGTGTSPSDKEVIVNEAKQPKAIRVDSQLKTPIGDSQVRFTPEVVLKKPKFAANLEEAKKLMKMRKFLDEEQRRMNQEAALLLEFHANVRPSMSQAYSSLSGPELEFACVSNEAKDVETNEMIEDFVNNTTNESIADISFEEIDSESNIEEVLVEQDFEITIIEEEISENEDAKSIYNQELAITSEDDRKTEDLDFHFFTGEEIFDALQKNATYADFLKQYTNNIKTKLFIVNCTKYEEDVFREVTDSEIVSYTRNGHSNYKEIKDIIDKEVKLPEESIKPIFSPIKSECSFELSSEYDMRIEDMVKTTSRQQIMEIILGSAIDESPSKMPRIDYCYDSSLESDNESCKRKFSEMDSPDNNNSTVLTPNKIRRICDTEEISSTTDEVKVEKNNHTDSNIQRSKYLGKARRVGLPKPKRMNLPISPSSDKSVENYEQNNQANGRIKSTIRNKVQRYDSSDLYKPKLHFLSKRNNVS